MGGLLHARSIADTTTGNYSSNWRECCEFSRQLGWSPSLAQLGRTWVEPRRAQHHLRHHQIEIGEYQVSNGCLRRTQASAITPMFLRLLFHTIDYQ
ncbi:hypothetical protein PHMEG_0005458 [Phytophthora megakarya]|uniref:Uncharacterized protein n=1 Tax=Phytophthora megakarya TaxID=4795 RepID=A0A225WRA7_9STRA|nr:hypothetical protein PHMEG_0005458 [Phytophthora megakarya]